MPAPGADAAGGQPRSRAAVLGPYGPSLPALLRARFGLAPAFTVACVLLAAAAMLAVAWALVRGGDDQTQLTHRAAPAFTLLYGPTMLRERPPRSGELARLEGRRGALRLSLVVTPLADGPVGLPALPILAGLRARAIAGGSDGFELLADGKARAGDAPGYQIEFLARGVRGRDVMLLPDEAAPGRGLILSLRRSRPGRPLKGAEGRLLAAATRAQRSLRFGTARE